MRKQQLAMQALLLALMSGVAVARAEGPSGPDKPKHGVEAGVGKGEHGKAQREGGEAAAASK